MSALNLRPNNDVLYASKWQEIYVLTRHWQSDVEFFARELNFLQRLISKYFIWLKTDAHIVFAEKLQGGLKDLFEIRKTLEKNINIHLHHISALMENAFIYDEHTFKDEHAILEEQLADFTKAFKALKMEIFKFTEEALGKENLEHLMEK
ncbi:MAG: hypothetical protein KDC69_05190 [Flavobacteriaceae bacterium]|nr:hypothetical protein [Flavobacteriaceae bacterium]